MSAVEAASAPVVVQKGFCLPRLLARRSRRASGDEATSSDVAKPEDSASTGDEASVPDAPTSSWPRLLARRSRRASEDEATSSIAKPEDNASTGDEASVPDAPTSSWLHSLVHKEGSTATESHREAETKLQADESEKKGLEGGSNKDPSKDSAEASVAAGNFLGTGVQQIFGLKSYEENAAEEGSKEALANGATNAGGVASNFLGAGVQQIIGAFDASTLGVEVELGALCVDPVFGKVEIGGLVIKNPPGYHSEHAVKAERLCIEIDLQKLIFSFGKDIDIKEASLQGVDVIFEKALCTSNLSQLVKNLQGEHDGPEGPVPAPQEDKKDATTTDVSVTLHKVVVENVGAKVTSKLTRGKGMRLEVGNIIYQDFATECGAGRAAVDVIRVLLMTIVKSILTTIMGKAATKNLDRSATSLFSVEESETSTQQIRAQDALPKESGLNTIFGFCAGRSDKRACF